LQADLEAKKNAYDGQTNAAPFQLQTNSVTPSPAAGTLTNAPAARRMVDRSTGKKFLYLGSNPNPANDRDPNNWQEE
jgi:hypothetical protein